jgi:lambda repressor-like predicted transcriptional regulator
VKLQLRRLDLRPYARIVQLPEGRVNSTVRPSTGYPDSRSEMNYRPQAALAVIRQRGQTIAQVAAQVRVDPVHLRNALKGRVHPCPEVRERLPKALKTQLDQLFDNEALARRYSGDVAGRPRRSPVAW